ncbi:MULTISPECIES: malonyl-ACP O-methyltransferase BioC [Legionella]|uniref:Malonyl-[acyl-carrier protein] O-methyltransferase n=1 Tax=Legionella septentrionalis TaxID=2498109 RepID=A0A3S1CMG2_9GAMM|nr:MULTISPECIES: malonyl-ACP O-methyltransferase BioC [Legionella]MCP0914090.1 malonyl-ACP O-methyltransferase BioC [Legionella sp. 27cVA30]RUQ90750.1 malonyl-[acyl-carrier protein] O-methyltransferase BioC [Legionella septentrionalis]RUQ99945.1 malonyl-[acyl-carrier protein] O-methyltransferase BioC [Legionella septentrionalis]RUR10211.1 malonyl-[acyl-carrier protein] O-methyltransferase BioC [Legionella septentrionalis]
MNIKTEICNAFNTHAAEYEEHAKVQLEIGERLFARLQYLKVQPRYVLDLGCGTGFFSQKLKQYYPAAHVIGLDLAHAMLLQAKKKQRFWKKWPLVTGDMTALPFAANLFDLVFANQVVHWSQPLSAVFAELSRIMKPDGCLMFTTLGPDTFLELRQAWSVVDHHAHTNEFTDMHDLGDLLLAEHFLDPVVDMEKLTMHYSTLPQLVNALKSQGVRNINSSRNRGLTGKKTWQKFTAAMGNLRTTMGKYPLTYEVVYGHAWKGAGRRIGTGTETLISVDSLRKKLEKN